MLAIENDNRNFGDPTGPELRNLLWIERQYSRRSFGIAVRGGLPVDDWRECRRANRLRRDKKRTRVRRSVRESPSPVGFCVGSGFRCGSVGRSAAGAERSYRLRYFEGWQERETRAGVVFGRCFEQALDALFC